MSSTHLIAHPFAFSVYVKFQFLCTTQITLSNKSSVILCATFHRGVWKVLHSSCTWSVPIKLTRTRIIVIFWWDRTSNIYMRDVGCLAIHFIIIIFIVIHRIVSALIDFYLSIRDLNEIKSLISNVWLNCLLFFFFFFVFLP